MSGQAREHWTWTGGEPVPAAEATVPYLDRGFQYGDGVFETLRASGGGVFLLGRHLERMASGLAALGIECPDAADRAREGVGVILRKLGPIPATVKIIVTRGVGPPGPSPRGDFTPRVLVTGRADPGAPPERMTAIVAGHPRNERSPLAGIKSLNYLEMALARAEAACAGADEAIVLNTSGRVAEASAANVFALLDGRLVTPSVEEGCLPGIVRAEVLRLAREGGVRAETGALPLEALYSAGEAFLTNSRIGVVPLVELDGRPVGGVACGPVTDALRAAFRAFEAGMRDRP